MTDKLILSKKHGVNPTISICFWCKEPEGIALLGNNYKGEDGKSAEAPRHMILSYNPCHKCVAIMEQGTVIIEVVEATDDTQPPIQDVGGVKLVPTGRWLVMQSEAANEAFNTMERKIMVRPELMAMLIQDIAAEDADATRH